MCLLHLSLPITERNREIVEFYWHQTWRLLNLFPLHFLLRQAEAGGLYENGHKKALSFYDGLLRRNMEKIEG